MSLTLVYIACLTRSGRLEKIAVVAQLVEHFLGKEEVMGSIPINSF